jgi:hypothetical protein
VRLPRRRRVPDVVRTVALEQGDRRVAWALTDDGRPVVATERGLVLPGRPRVDWSDVERAGWQRPALTVVESSEVAGSGCTTTVVLADDDGGLPEVVRAGVSSSVAWSRHVRLVPTGGVRVVGRRRPGQELLDWQCVYDPGTDVSDPEIRAQAESVVLRARRSVG